ncbi:MAG: hypothetical protein HY924_15785 [Elusimicrobia bacterium]|nr:hypothetical protein [Elusimicrobiota bacterium]
MNRSAITILLVVLTAIGGLFFISAFMDIVVLMGRHIPQEDLATDYLVGLTWAVFLGITILIWPAPGQDKKFLCWAWTIKCLVTLGFMLIYENHYPTDAFGYFEEAKSEFYVWSMFRLGQGGENVIRLAHLHTMLFPASFHMMKVTFSMIGFIALYTFYRAGTLFIGKGSALVFWTVMLFPTHIFWSSILGKDPIILLGVACYAYGVIGWYRLDRPRYLIFMALGILGAMFIRVWMGAILTLPLSAFFISRIRSMLGRMTFIAVVLMCFHFANERVRERFNIETRQEIVQTAAGTAQAWAIGGSAQLMDSQFDSLQRMILFLPIGVSSALFRPLPGEVANLFGALASLENVAFLLLVLVAIVRSRWYDLLDPMVLWATALLGTWAFTYAFVSYQNLGTAARFKMQIMPIFIGLIMYLSRRRAVVAVQPTQAQKAPAASL